jgi:hypothetical protein
MDNLRYRFLIYIAILLAVMAFGTFGFKATEGLSLQDAFYFSMVSIATVGYGDIHPTTQGGKILAIFLILLGVGTFLGVVANATEVMLNRRERKIRMEKLNIVIGVFYSEVGTRLLTLFAHADNQADTLGSRMVIKADWKEKDFLSASQRIRNYRSGLDIHKIDLKELRDFLLAKRALLISLLENPILMEHESFTDLLWAIFHFCDELTHRKDFKKLPESDKAHLAGDINRAYLLLIRQWLHYMIYLQKSYPYLFSLAIRINPFDKEATPIVTS